MPRRPSRAGVEVSEHCGMDSLERGGDRVRAVRTTDDERIETGRGVILLSNSEVAGQLRSLSGLRLPVWNACLQVLMSEPLATIPLRHLIGHVGRTVSLKAHGDDRVMISGGWMGSWDEATRTGTVREASVAGNLAETIAVYPCLSGIGVGEADAGHLEAMSVDDIPDHRHRARHRQPLVWNRLVRAWLGNRAGYR